MKKKKKWLWGMILIIGLILVVIGANQWLAKKEKPVVLGQAEEGLIIEKIYTNGKLEPVSSADYFAPIDGRIEKVNAKIGDQVEPGQVLLVLNIEAYEEQLALERINRQLIEAERDRIKKENFDAFVKAQREDPDTAATKPLDLTEYELQLKKSQLLIDSYQRKVDQKEVTAKSAGIVKDVAVREGEVVGPGTSLLTTQDISAYQIKAQVSEIDANKITVGMEAKVLGDSLPDSYTGKVVKISPFATAAGTSANDASVELIIELDGQHTGLRAGYSVSVEMEIADVSRLLIPLDAVMYRNDQAYVFKVVDDRAVEVEVKTGKESDEQVEVLSGIAEGERIVIEGAGFIKDGDRVSTL